MNCVPQRVLMRDIAFLAFTLHIDVIFWVKERGNKIFSWKHGLCNHLTIWKYFMVQTTTFIINQDQTKTILSFTIYILQTLQWGHFVFVSLQAGGLKELAGWCEQITVRMWNTTYIWFRGIIQMFMKTLIVKKSIRQIAKETFVKH